MTAGLNSLKTAAETGFAQAFAGLRRDRGDGPLVAVREAAYRQFEAQGLPDRRREAWRYTDLRALMHDAKPLAAVPDAAAKARAAVAAGLFTQVAARRMVFVDGAFVAERSDLSGLEPGLNISPLAAALQGGALAAAARLAIPGPASGDVAYSLNTAFMSDGAIIEVAAGARIARPLHLVFFYGGDQPAAVFSRCQVVLGAGAGLTVIETHVGPNGMDYQVNTALDIAIGDDARLDRVNVIAEGDAALHLSTVGATIGARAGLHDFTLLSGGQTVRNQLFVRCGGTGATLGLGGVSLLRGKQHGDTFMFVNHVAGGCVARELFKSVVDGSSRGVFQGKIVVRQGAQKTDARMMSRALLLSAEAEADNKPELEIFADDVQCGHGATCGSLDDNLKFYLMARGVPEKDAETLLIQSFVGEAFDTVTHEGIRDALAERALQWLGGRQ